MTANFSLDGVFGGRRVAMRLRRAEKCDAAQIAARGADSHAKLLLTMRERYPVDRPA